MPHSLPEFIDALAAAGQLHRVKAEVTGDLEIAEITRRVAAELGPALLFERVRDCVVPVATNLLGSRERVCLAFNVPTLDALDERLQSIAASAPDRSWLDRMRQGPTASEQFRPKVIKSGDCQQVVRLGRDIDFEKWPLLRSWPQEAEFAFTSAVVISEDPATQARSLEAHRVVRSGAQQLTIVEEPYSALARNSAAFRERGKPMPSAIVLGGDPAYGISAQMLRVHDLDGYLFAGLLRGAAVELVKCRTQPLEVPADADVVIEGTIENSTMQVTAVTHRSKPIVPAMIPADRSPETAAIDDVRGRLVRGVLRASLPELVDLALPSTGGLNAMCVVSIRKTFPHQARKVASAIAGHSATMLCKCIAVADGSVDVHDISAVLSALAANVHPARDVFTQSGPVDPRDYARPSNSSGSCVIVDATTKLPGEHDLPWPERRAVDAATRALVDERISEYGLEQILRTVVHE